MVADDAIEFSIAKAFDAIDRQFRGDFVECGTWQGGCSFANLLAQRARYGKVIKPVWFFDSFEGLPEAEDRDGPAAKLYQADTASIRYYDNCRASIEIVEDAKQRFGFSDEEAILVKGWFEESLPVRLEELRARKIASLRIDCDWYRPVRFVLETLEPIVTNGATVIIDDYYAWDGCARATHDYLSSNDLCYRIKSLPSFNGAWFDKIHSVIY